MHLRRVLAKHGVRYVHLKSGLVCGWGRGKWYKILRCALLFVLLVVLVLDDTAPAFAVNHDDLPRLDLTEQDFLGQLIFDLALDGATQRTGTEYRVEDRWAALRRDDPPDRVMVDEIKKLP